MRGTLLNTATVAVGATLGMAVGRVIPVDDKAVALHGLGIVTLGIGMKMLLQARNPLIVAVSIAAGGILGMAMGLGTALESLASWARDSLGQTGSDTFVPGLITTFVLFCIGPMTLLGCLQDALEDKIELLSLKATLDGIGAVFFAATTGAAVLVTAALLLIFQGLITLLARYLKPVVDDADALAELSATGGVMLVGTGFGLLDIRDFHMIVYLPAIVLAPFIVIVSRKVRLKRAS